MTIKRFFYFLNKLSLSRKSNFSLNLRPGEIVEVLNEREILATLDENKTLEGLPFTSEMHKYCGRRFKVLKRADRIIVEAKGIGLRRMKNTVMLDGATCDGKAHGGCQSSCLHLWKETWLKRMQ